MKARLVVIFTVLSLILLAGFFGSCANMARLRSAHDREMATRLDLEERMSRFSQEKAEADNKIAGVSQVLEEEKAAHQATKKALLQEQLNNQGLKQELDRVNELKTALEENLKDALVANKKSTKTTKK